MKTLSKKTKKIIAAVAILAAVIVIIIAGNSLNISANTINCGVAKTNNSSVTLNISMAQLAEKNIEIGDSVNIKFNTGYNVEDVAILNGEFLNTGRHVIIVGDENSKPVFQIQNIEDTWGKASLDENSVAQFSLCSKAKFKSLNDALKRPLLTDTQNVRSIRGGNLKLLDVFRASESKTSGQLNAISKEFMKQISIKNTINLSDNSYGVTCFNIKDVNCNKLVCDTLFALVKNNSSTLLWSTNEDLTAYTCAIIEAIGGASYDEIVADYMETYKNYYGITKDETPQEYEAVKTWHIDAFLHQLTKTPSDFDLHRSNFAYDAEMYLRARQVHTDDIEKIKSRLCQ